MIRWWAEWGPVDMAVCLVGWFVCQPASHGNSSVIPVAWRYTSEEQIAAEIRRRPIGAVIADICRDLGIRPGNKLWSELRHLVLRHGGSLARLVKDILERPLELSPALAWPSSPLPASARPSSAPPGIGPPG